jgi:hypothetical protein
LLSQSESEIISTLKDIDNQAKELRHELLKICWYMRGGITFEESATLSPQDREMIGKLVKDNLETTKKTGQPFF